MLRQALSLALAAVLLLPAAGLAADPVAPPIAPAAPGHYYVVEGVERGANTIKVQGKLWIEGDRLGVSVGCNTIGAAIAFDGKILRITGPLTTTEMGCPADLAAAESGLIAALGGGPFSVDGSAFSGKDVRILAAAMGTRTGPIMPPDGGVIVYPGIPFDPLLCKDLVTPEEWSALFGAEGASDGSTGAAPGSAPGFDPGATPGSQPGAAAGSGSGSSSGSAGSAGSGATTITNPAPGRVAPATPFGPAGTPGVVEPFPRPGVVPPAVSLPLPSVPAGKGAPVVGPGPAATPSAELCRELLTRVQALATDMMGLPKAAGGATNELAVARDAASITRVSGEASFALILALGLLLIGWIRSVAGRPSPGSD